MNIHCPFHSVAAAACHIRIIICKSRRWFVKVNYLMYERTNGRTDRRTKLRNGRNGRRTLCGLPEPRNVGRHSNRIRHRDLWYSGHQIVLSPPNSPSLSFHSPHQHQSKNHASAWARRNFTLPERNAYDVLHLHWNAGDEIRTRFYYKCALKPGVHQIHSRCRGTDDANGQEESFRARLFNITKTALLSDYGDEDRSAGLVVCHS